jgi:hypothetical protein
MSKESTADNQMSLEEAARQPDPAIFESMLKQLTDQGAKRISEEELLLGAAGRGDVAVATTASERHRYGDTQ